MLKAVADKLIPGLPIKLRILLLSQIEDSSRGEADEGASVLEHVLGGDRRRLDLLEKHKGPRPPAIRRPQTPLLTSIAALTAIVESPSPLEAKKIMDSLHLAQKRYDLGEAQKLALRRSGARGKEARAGEIQAEKDLKEAEEA